MAWYAAAREHRPPWIQVARLLGEHGIPQDTPAGRAEFQRRMEIRRREETGEQTLQALRENWCFGSETFRQELLQRAEGQLGEHHAGALHRDASEARADRILAQELARLGWTKQELAAARKSDPRKLSIAARLRKETTLPIKDIAARVHLGTSKSANATLHRFMSETKHSNATVGI